MADLGITPPVTGNANPDAVLCFMQLPPNAEGHGGSQRAWFLTNAIQAHAPVHFVLLHPAADTQVAGIDFTPLREIAESVTLIPIPEWDATSQRIRRLPKRIGRYIDLVRMRSIFTPRFSRATISRIARQLPVRHAGTVFAGRLPTALIVNALLASGELSCDRKVVDFDDIQSEFQRRSFAAEQRPWDVDKRLINALTLRMILDAEHDVAHDWHGIAICSDDDRHALEQRFPAAEIFKIPNIVEKPLLPVRSGDGFTILFVGNLSFGPNAHGLKIFLDEAWPSIHAALPHARLSVVGMNPSEALKEKLAQPGISLHANVPSVTPFYSDADAVIAPIFFGSGTRIKILEAMAFGRPVVSTTLGAEGLGIQPGEQAVIADSMPDFAAALIALAQSPEQRLRLIEKARDLQQQEFGPPSMKRAMKKMLAPLTPVGSE